MKRHIGISVLEVMTMSISTHRTHLLAFPFKMFALRCSKLGFLTPAPVFRHRRLTGKTALPSRLDPALAKRLSLFVDRCACALSLQLGTMNV